MRQHPHQNFVRELIQTKALCRGQAWKNRMEQYVTCEELRWAIIYLCLTAKPLDGNKARSFYARAI